MIPNKKIASLPQKERSVTVSRDQLSHRFGGNTMDTFPRPSARHIAAHGRANFMCINLLWNPHGPQVPGHGGLFFEATMWPGDAWTANPKHMDVQTLFVRIAQGQWLYLGEYELQFSRSLTSERWRDLHESVRDTWVREIHGRKWGRTVRARVHLRQALARSPTRDEVEDAPGLFKNITEGDIRAALESGDESIRAWSMKCIGYDENFQRELIKLT
ncbi:hypothetical protein C8Q80DRAFT_1218424 [Daedaleopsis nitida]|nr:hypothetical protein C8Q80DRAFT_1218424 [Daedaleopsis nitida]